MGIRCIVSIVTMAHRYKLSKFATFKAYFHWRGWSGMTQLNGIPPAVLPDQMQQGKIKIITCWEIHLIKMLSSCYMYQRSKHSETLTQRLVLTLIDCHLLVIPLPIPPPIASSNPISFDTPVTSTSHLNYWEMCILKYSQI